MLNIQRIHAAYVGGVCELEFRVDKSSATSDAVESFLRNVRKCDIFIGNYYFLINWNTQLCIFRSTYPFDLVNLDYIRLKVNPENNMMRASLHCLPPSEANFAKFSSLPLSGQLKKVTDICLLNINDELIKPEGSKGHGIASKLQFGKHLQFECDFDRQKATSDVSPSVEKFIPEKYELHFVPLQNPEGLDNHTQMTSNFKGYIVGREEECLFHFLNDKFELMETPDESNVQRLGCGHINVIMGICTLDADRFSSHGLEGDSIGVRNVLSATLTFMDVFAKEFGNNKAIVQEIIIRCLADQKLSLLKVKERIEDTFHRSLSYIDDVYIESNYIRYLSQLWIKEITEALQMLSGDIYKSTAIRDILISLDNIRRLSEIPDPVKTLDYHRLLVGQCELVSKLDEIRLVGKFKEEFLVHIIDCNRTAREELTFLKALVEFLRSCFNDLQSVITDLHLREFCNDELSFDVLLKSILCLDQGRGGNDNLAALQKAATSLLEETQLVLMTNIKEVIGSYIQPVEIEEKKIDNRSIIEVRGKIIAIGDILTDLDSKLSENAKIEEVRFIGGDVIHIDKDLDNDKWHGKNIVLLTNTVKVHCKVSWNVSGLNNSNTFASNAGSDHNGDGKQGADGYAGESGGNVLILAKKIDNPENISITSHGGDGSNGQDGGDGENGADGKGISAQTFKSRYPSIISTGSQAIHRPGMLNKFRDSIHKEFSYKGSKVNWSKSGSCYIEGETPAGNKIMFSYYSPGFCEYYQAYILYKGSLGKPGGNGGEYGLGGQGGYPGEILAKSLQNNQAFNISKYAQYGTDGANGKGGLYGRHGKNGWDMGFLDFQLWTDVRRFGLDQNSKLELYSYSSNHNTRVWCGYKKKYVTLGSSQIEHKKNEKYDERKNTRQNSERQRQAQAARKNGISQSNILNSYSQYLTSDERSLFQDLSSRLENAQEHALQAIADLRLDRENHSVDRAAHRQVSSDKKNGEKRPDRPKPDPNCKDTTTADALINVLKRDPQVLDNWLQLNTAEVNRFDLRELFVCFEELKRGLLEKADHPSDTEKKKIIALEKLLIVKYRYAALQEIAKQLPVEHKEEDFLKVTPEGAARYLFEDKFKDNKISHPILGTLNQYFYQNTKEQQKNISKFYNEELQGSGEKHEILMRSIIRFILEEGKSQAADPIIKHYCDGYRAISEKHERSSKIYFEAFKSELSQPRHEEIYKLWIESIKDKSLQSKLEKETEKDVFLMKLYKRFEKQLEHYNEQTDEHWEKCCKDETVLKEFAHDIETKGPLSGSYRELLAYTYDANIRMYTEDENNNPRLQDNHNAASMQVIHVLYRDGKFWQMSVNEDYLRLEEERNRSDTIYARILAELDSFNQPQEFDEYVADRAFLDGKDVQKLDQYFYYEQGDIRSILKYFSEEEGQQLKPRLDKITSQFVGQQGLLHFIVKRFSSEGRHVSSQELYFLVNSVLSSRIEDSLLENTFSWIISAYPQRSWIDELLLLQLENTFKQSLPEKSKLRQYLRQIENIDILLLLNVQLDQHRQDSYVSIQYIDEILYMLSSIPSESVYLEGLQLSEWTYALKENYWTCKLSQLMDWQKSDLATASYYLLSMENTFGNHLVEKFTEILKSKTQHLTADMLTDILLNFHSEEWNLSEVVLKSLLTLDVVTWRQEMVQKFSAIEKARDICQLIEIIRGNANTSRGIVANLSSIEGTVNAIASWVELTEADIRHWTQQQRRSATINAKELFAVIDRAIELRRGFRMRDTQMLTTLALYGNHPNKTLAQVSTGEGKSLIVVALSIAKALHGEKVDVITSSSVLAKRDAKENRDIYDMFGISVAHNCSEQIDSRKSAYSDNMVVYGDLSNFQRDYLLDKFYGKNILGDRQFENVIVDEVDSMLLDRGNNMLYLSHDLAGLDKLESLYIFIWQWLNRPVIGSAQISLVYDTKAIKEAVLNDLYGLILEGDIGKLDSKLTDRQRKAIYERLIKAAVLDVKGTIRIESLDDIKLTEVLSSEFIHYTDRLRYLLKECIERERHIRVPNYLRAFIERHLESWIESAKIAFFMKAGQDYVVDVDRTGSSPDRNPNITILDRDTGTDQANSQWDEALHQFLQLKHGCKLSMQSLKAVFISNVSYFKLYRTLYGLTGTLGSQRERDLLQEIHKVDFVTIPTAKSKQFIEHKPVLCASAEEWINSIRDSVYKLIGSRSVLVICETVNDVEIIHKAFGGKGTKDVHTYTRDYEVFDLAQGKTGLNKGHIIIATNLAGRGTDIKIGQELERAGGLHVCLTYLPSNIRIEQQAFGRAARKGENGSGQLIIMKSSGQQSNRSTIFDLRKSRNSEELYRISDTKASYETRIVGEEKCFDEFRKQYEVLKKRLQKKQVPEKVTDILLQSTLDKWAFWLDENGKRISNLIDAQTKRNFDEVLNQFLSHMNLSISKDDSRSWFAYVEGNPAQMVKLAKYLSQTGKKNLTNAVELFDEVINRESYFSEIAHYYKAFALAKQIDWERNPVNAFDLKRFKKELREAAQLFDERTNAGVIYAAIIGKIKKRNNASIIQIDAYEEQQKSMANLYYLFSRSIDDIFGHIIPPKSLTNHDVNESLAQDLHEYLLQEGILKKPRVASNIPREQIKEISLAYGIAEATLMSFLSKYEGSEVDEISLQKALKAAVLLPSREVFWKLLIEHEILKDDIKYIIVDNEKLGGADDPLLELLKDKIHKKQLRREAFELPNDGDWVFLKAELLEQQGNSDVFEKSHFIDTLSRDKYRALKKTGILSSNRRAFLDKSKVQSIETLRLFDSITLNDFDMVDIVGHEAKLVLSELVAQRIIEERPDTMRGHYALRVQYDELESIQLTSCPAYESDVKGLLSARFAYRLVLQRIVRQLEENISPIRLSLMTKPHRTLVADLLALRIIKQIPLNAPQESIDMALTRILQNKKIHLADDTIRRIISTLDESRGALDTLQVPSGKLQAFTEVCSEYDFGNIEEMIVFQLNGLDLLLQLEEKKWTLKMIINTIIVTCVGIAQMAIGTAIELLSVGVLSNVGAAFLSEGIGDLTFSVGCFASGYFSWNDYKDQKIESLIITAATGGIGALLSKSTKFARFGHKLAGPVFGSGLLKGATLKALGREVTKRVTINALKKVTITLANKGVELLLENLIQGLCNSISTLILSGMEEKVHQHPVYHTLADACTTFGVEHATGMVDSITKAVFTTQQFNQFLGKAFQDITSDVFKQIAEAVDKVETDTSVKRIIDRLNKLFCITMFLAKIKEICSLTSTFLQCVDGPIKDNLAKNKNSKMPAVSHTDIKQFQEQITEKWKIVLNEKVGQLINEAIVGPILEKGVKLIGAAVAKVEKACRSSKESLYLERFEEMKRQYNQQMKDLSDREQGEHGLTSQTEIQITEKYQRDLHKLMTKTRSPELLAAIVRENVPMDITCAAACTKVVHTVLEEQGLSEGLTIVVEGEDGIRQSFTSGSEGVVVRLRLRANRFQLTDDGALESDEGVTHSLFKALSEAIPELNGTSSKFREKVCHVIENDQDVQKYIRGRWYRAPKSSPSIVQIERDTPDRLEVQLMTSLHIYATNSVQPEVVRPTVELVIAGPAVAERPSIRKYASDWHGTGVNVRGVESTNLKQLESIDFGRSLTTEDVAVIRRVREDFIHMTDNRLARGKLNRREAAQLIRMKASVDDIKIAQLFQNAREHYNGPYRKG